MAERLLPNHLADLRNSGLSDITIAAFGYFSEDDPSKNAKNLNWKHPAVDLGPCLCIPYFGADGKECGYIRLKPDRPRKTNKDKGGGERANKYESPRGQPNRAYIPPATRDALTKPSTLVLLTEGEKKAAKAEQEGFHCIGLTGVYGFQKKREKKNGKPVGPRELIDDLATIDWRGKLIVVAYDSDIASKPEVQRAERHAAETFRAAGANVKAIRLPNGPNGEKQGLDDYLVRNGPEAFRHLIGNATDVEPEPEVPLDNPHRLAALFVEAMGSRCLRYWQGEFLGYESCAYRAYTDECVRGELATWLEIEFKNIARIQMTGWAKAREKGELSAREIIQPPAVRPVTVSIVNNVLQALRGIRLLADSVVPPAWIDGVKGPDPAKILSMRNGLLNLNDAVAKLPRCLSPATPSFFTRTALPFDYNPNAPTPHEWLKFLDLIWQADQESIEALQEWFGYLLTPDKRQHKILFMLGPTRSGKGTIARIMKELVGEFNVVNPTLGSLAGVFGLQPLLGKSVAIVSDARISGRADEATIVEALLSISGDDSLTVHRKHRESVTGKLPTRFVIISNELPRLKDKSGAFPGRIILLRMVRSWYDREDTNLIDRLLPELPGILLWSIEGWRRLQKRGQFVQPGSGAGPIDEIKNLSSPIRAFIGSKCVTGQGDDFRERVSELYAAWCSWCESHGYKSPGVEEGFGRDLRAVIPELEKKQRREGREKPYYYHGVRLRRFDEPETDEGNSVFGVSGGAVAPKTPPKTTEVPTIEDNTSSVFGVFGKSTNSGLEKEEEKEEISDIYKLQWQTTKDTKDTKDTHDQTHKLSRKSYGNDDRLRDLRDSA